MGMFCYQCQETKNNTGCDIRGVCGKTEGVDRLLDLINYTLKGISLIIRTGNINIEKIPDTNYEVLNSLFIGITNVNFDEEALEDQIRRMIEHRDKLKKEISIEDPHDAITFEVTDKDSMISKGAQVGVLSTEDEDIRSLRATITYGLKGIAAYTLHAFKIGKRNPEIHEFIYEALAATLDDTLTIDDYLELTLRTGECGVKAMALLDDANTSRYGHPEITNVNIGVRNNPAILISGHDLVDLEQLLEQTKGTGVDVYTHGEMLPAHAYPFFKKYDNLVGNYGNSWWEQVTEFKPFHGPILFTTNCLVPPSNDEIRDRIFTTDPVGYPGCIHIDADDSGKKDFSQIIELAKTLPPPDEIESGSIVIGFAHNQVFALADRVVEAVKSGAIKKFFVMGGCDGRFKSREYYTEFAKQLPKDTVILTAGCAKYRYNKLELGDIDGIPRVLDAGQCNDSYSLVLIALKLKEVFGLEDINDLPVVFNIAWYEQKAVTVFLALLYLGVRNVHVGPTLPGFLSPNVVKVLVEKFGVAGIGTVEDDIKVFMSC